jgi:hypothetical protein
MANETFDFNKLTPKQQAALSRALHRIMHEELAGAPAEPDFSKEPVVMTSHGSPSIAYRVEGDTLVDKDGTRYGPDKHKGFAVSPADGTGLGHAPVAYNGRVVASLEHHEALRNGDAAVLAEYASLHESEDVA